MLERKIIRSREGYRIVNNDSYWEGIAYRGGSTLVVQHITRGNPRFTVKDVATEGIVGQCQLTFDNRAAAEDFLNRTRNSWRGDPDNWRISITRKDYNCIKVPVIDVRSGVTADAWLSVNVLPEEGSEQWDELKNLYPDYFENLSTSFFDEAYTEVARPREAWKIVVRPQSSGGVIKINMPTVSKKNFRASCVSTSSMYNGSWFILGFLSESEAQRFLDRWLQQHNYAENAWERNLEVVPYKPACYSTMVKIPVEGNEDIECYLRSEAFPRRNTLEGAQWWEEMEGAYPDYFRDYTPGFFDEDLDEALTANKFQTIDNNLVKRTILGYVKTYGYVSGSYGYHNNNYTSYRGSSTVAELKKIFDEGTMNDYACDQSYLDQMEHYVENLVPSGQYAAYQTKCIEAWNKQHIDKDDLSLVASFCSSFVHEQAYQARQEQKRQRELQHQQDVESESNRWAGAVGDEVDFVVASAKIATFIQPPYYNATSYPLWKIVDQNGLTYSWGDTKAEVEIEPGDRIHAKIKKLNEYRGIKETQIWKVSIDGVQTSFFD